MHTQQEMEERLWDYIDGFCSPGERSAIESLIAGDHRWQHKYSELLEAHRTMANAELEVPSLRFTRNTMEAIGRHRVAPPTNSYLNKHIIRGIASFFLVTIGGFLIYSFTMLKGSGGHPSPPVLPYEQALQEHLDKFNWSRIFSGNFMNVSIMVNLILGLMLLDMYLARKKRQGSRLEAR